MCTAIVKTGGRSAIQLCFPPDIRLCCLTLDVIPAEVHYIAKELFGVHVRERNKQRFVYTENGSAMEINGCLRLRMRVGTEISRLFGDQIGLSFFHSLLYLKELEAGETFSMALSMDVWAAEDAPARFIIMADPVRLSETRHRLWPSPFLIPS